jgi:myo-inositol 2-dehydrogenase / D-chiro-inositol 1-dehydrogenase
MNASHPTRREFLKTTSAAALAGAVVSGFPAVLRGAPDTRKITIGLVGCGGRGTGAVADAMHADPNVVLTTMGDLFDEKLQPALKILKTQFGERIDVAPERCFLGLDAYRKVLETDIDMVLLAAPGGFRSVHLKAAIEAGKHVFCEKPMAIDGPGLRAVIESVELAKKKNLAIRAGLNLRFDPPMREGMKRIHDGAIGDVVSIYTIRTGGTLISKFTGERKPEWNDLEWQLRNWANFNWLSGDWMMEVAIHTIDKIAWAMRDVPPAKVVASGGRQIPSYGNVYDHFDVAYEWDNGVIATHKFRAQDPSWKEHRDVIFGTKGQCTLGWSAAAIAGETNWRYEGPKPNSHQIEHEELFADLRAGRIPNDGDRMVKSTLMAMMGRMSAYTGQLLTWDQAMNSQERLMPEKLDWDAPLPVKPLAVPGETRFL